jgi:hypothetical protein
MNEEAEGAGPASEGAGGREAPSEEELRRRIEEELRKLSVQDVLLQSVVNLINLSSRRIAMEDERDLEQARVGIEAVRALADLLEDEPARQVRNALSDLQMAYAREAGAEPAGTGRGAGPVPPEEGEAAAAERRAGAEKPPPRKPPPDLWTPPGST